MSNRRYVTLLLMALALAIQVLGPLLLEASKPAESHHRHLTVGAQLSYGQAGMQQDLVVASRGSGATSAHEFAVTALDRAR